MYKTECTKGVIKTYETNNENVKRTECVNRVTKKCKTNN